ncbi:MAG: DUF2442 domain-containing protein [Planctomycetes bacterium]|nr:DUF2442 domain-containing protein [Planctomycetota bacterium]
MEHDVIDVRASAGTRIAVRFRDGASGEVDVARLVPFEGVFAPLCEPAFFARVAVHPETFTVMWPNGADIDSDVLYEVATGVTGSLPGAKRAD